MRWRQRARARQLEEMELLLLVQRLQLEATLRALLLEALTPLAQALQRQDSLLLEQSRLTREALQQFRLETADLLTEVLSSLQPSAQAQLLPLIGPLSPPPSSRSLVS